MSSRVTRSGEIIPLQTRQKISERYKRMTKAINKAFWNSESVKFSTTEIEIIDF